MLIREGSSTRAILDDDKPFLKEPSARCPGGSKTGRATRRERRPWPPRTVIRPDAGHGRDSSREEQLDKIGPPLRPQGRVILAAMNRETLGRLYDEEAEGVYRYVLALAGREETAKDLLQDVFVKLANGNMPLAGVRDVRAYLFRMARNLFIDRTRREQSGRERGERWGAGIRPGGAQARSGPEGVGGLVGRRIGGTARGATQRRGPAPLGRVELRENR